MIIVRIFGGLGNQMFQFAAAKSLAKKYGCALRLDASSFVHSAAHQGFELEEVFGLEDEFASEDDYRQVLGGRGNKQIRKLLMRRQFVWARPRSYIAEPHFNYWSGIRSVPKNTYLDGYWQSERYFHSEAVLIRDSFTFVKPLLRRNRELADQIQSCNSVSVHVRRGDYVTNPKVNQIHGSCSLEYYKQAFEKIRSHLDSPHFFVFSDDPTWVKNNLVMPSTTTFVDHNTADESYNDMRLMMLCTHHVIANSSFSWWGAWLGTSAEKLVIAPKRWFQEGQTNTEDLYCEGWLRL